MRWFKRAITPTLMLSEAGVLVEALESHMYPPTGKPIGPYQQELPAPRGSAVVAVQFRHEVGTRFSDLQIFRLHYVHRAPGRDLYEEYLAAPFDTLEMAATPADASALNSNQRQVLAKLLQGSDAKAWDDSPDVRAAIGF
jgi:hypothetical protein